MTFLVAIKALALVKSQCIDFANIFSLKSVTNLIEYTKINHHFIDLVNDK